MVIQVIEDLDRLMETEGVDAIVFEGNAFEKPDVFWLTGFRSSDTILCLHQVGEETVVGAAYHTLTRLLKETRIRKTFDLTEIHNQLKAENRRILEFQELIYGPFLREHFTGRVIGVPDHAPASIVIALQRLGYTVKVVPYLLKNARARKSTEETRAIQKCNEATVDALKVVVEIIKDSEIGPNRTLIYDGGPLTVQHLKLAVDRKLLEMSAESAEDMIVAVGTSGSDWHSHGQMNDLLKAEEPVIIDVFPRLKLDRYVADVTRTVVKGRIDSQLRRMFDAVTSSIDAVVDCLTDQVLIEDVNNVCYQQLISHGFDSKYLNVHTEEGMTHGLGHGIGLEVHENPSLYEYSSRLQEGNVLAIEPGVYLKTVGGVRIENDYLITKGRPQLLTTGLEDIIFV